MKAHFRRTSNGFTLIEIAIVLAIIGIITAGLVTGMGAMRETAKFKEDQRKLQDIKSALLGFVAVNDYLPCPDTDGSGSENRTPDPDGRCTSTSGTLPYLDLNTHARNAYGFAFSYHVNTNANNLTAIQSSGNSASYFGKCASGQCFNIDTPPRAGDATADLGNYRISDGTNPIANQVPLVVISHGKDFKDNLTCNGNSNFENWNCDLSQTEDNQTLLFQAQQGTDFDDVIIWISGLEIKQLAGLLSGQANNGNNNGNNNGGGSGNQHNPTERADDSLFNDFDTVHTTSGGNYNNQHNIPTSNDDNAIQIGNNLNKAIDLQEGNNLLDIVNNANAQITAGSGDNTIRIQGETNQPINLGDGDNIIEIRGNLNTAITAGNGNNSIRIEGTVNGSGITLGTGENSIYVGGDINQSINGGGNATLYLNKTPVQWQAASWQHTHLTGFSSTLCRETIGGNNFVSCT